MDSLDEREPVRKRLAVAFTTAILVVPVVSGCQNSEQTKLRPAAYECTDAGQRDTHVLVVALRAPSPRTKVFDLCLSRWNTAGVRIDPFVSHAKLSEAQAAATERFVCDTPVHPPNMLPGEAATLDCMIDGVRAEVALLREGRDVSANIYPRE